MFLLGVHRLSEPRTLAALKTRLRGQYAARSVPVDIELFNKKDDIEDGVDPLIVCALELLKSRDGRTSVQRPRK